MTDQQPAQDLILFSYDTLPAADAAAIRQHEANIRQRAQDIKQSTVEAAIYIGNELNAVKARLPHGQFGPWIGEAFPDISVRTAQRYMNLAALKDTVPDLEELPVAVTAWHKLAAPSTDPAVRESVIDAARAGDDITSGDVEDAVITRQQEDAALIKDLFYERRATKLEHDVIRKYSGLPDDEGRLIKALRLLSADGWLEKNGPFYIRQITIDDPDLDHWCGHPAQIAAAILATLDKHGPRKASDICQGVNAQWDRITPAAFDLAVQQLLTDGAIVKPDKLTLALPPDDAEDRGDENGPASPPLRSGERGPGGEADLDIIALSNDLQPQILDLLEQKSRRHVELREHFGIDGGDPRMPALKRALDTLLGQQKIIKRGVFYLIDTLSTGENVELTSDAVREAILDLLAEQPLTVVNLMNFTKQRFEVSYLGPVFMETLRALEDDGSVVRRDEDNCYHLVEPHPAELPAQHHEPARDPAADVDPDPPASHTGRRVTQEDRLAYLSLSSQRHAPLGDEDKAQIDAAKQAVLGAFNGAGKAYFSHIYGDLKHQYPNRLISYAIRELTHERRIAKHGTDGWLRIIEPHDELLVALNTLDGQLRAVQREIDALPRDRMNDEQRRAALAQIDKTWAEINRIKIELSQLSSNLGADLPAGNPASDDIDVAA